MNKLVSLGALPVLTLALSGCFDGSNSSGGDDRPDPAVDFTTFVRGEIQNTDNTREPVSLNDKEFSFNDQNNEQAFDELFIE